MAGDVDYLTSKIRRAVAGGAAVLPIAAALVGQSGPAGRVLFESQCASCHGGDGPGGPLGPAIVNRMQARGDTQIAAVIRDGIPSGGMPAFQLSRQQTS